MAELRIRTGIPDEIGGHWVAFANVFERDERPGQLSVILVTADETRTILAPGDAFAVGGIELTLQAIEAKGEGHVVVLEPVEPQVAASSLPQPVQYALPPIPAGQLVDLLVSATPDILEKLGERQVPLDWEANSTSTFNREWTGAEIGPITTVRQVARFAAGAVTAEVVETDIRYEPEALHSREVSGFWRTVNGRAHVFCRTGWDDPMTTLYAAPEAAEVVALLVEKIGRAVG